MQLQSSLPDAVVISQDDQSEIHVQAVIQGGRRHVDARAWRRGPAGFAPGRTGLTLNTADLNALRAGIAELLDASDGGSTVARIVWDDDHGRRLRAEIEPFGTRHIARLGFWQRVRDTWRPADDGLVLAADRLRALQDVLDRFRPWVAETADDDLIELGVLPGGRHAIMDPWPPPGADWLTVEPDRIAFHPRGIRITCGLQEQNGRHWLLLRQWRRNDSLWLPEEAALALTIVDLDRILPCLLRIAERQREGEQDVREEVRCLDGSAVRVALSTTHGESLLRIEQQESPHGGSPHGFQPRLTLPASYLPWFGRALTQAWSLLIGWLSEAEREELRNRMEEAPVRGDSDPSPDSPTASASPAPEPGEEDAPLAALVHGEESPPGQSDAGLSSDAAGFDSAERGAHAPDPMEEMQEVARLPFAVESETPGAILLTRHLVRISVDNDPAASSITLPTRTLSRLLGGLEELNRLCRQQARVDPILLYDRPDCAVYGRVGTLARPTAVELRVWTSHTTSDSVSFEVMYLPELIDGLRQCLFLLGEPASILRVPVRPPRDRPLPDRPARRRPITPAVPLWSPGNGAPGPAAASDVEPDAGGSISLGTIEIGRHRVSLRAEHQHHRHVLALQWEGNSLELPGDELADLLARMRQMYYEALRGRRGQTLSIGQYPPVTIGVHSEGGELCFVFQQETEGEVTSLSFPVREVPRLLDAAQGAVSDNST